MFEDERNHTIVESNRLDLTNSCPEELELSKWENRSKEGKNGAAAAFTGKWVHEESWFPATNRPAFHLRGNAVSKGGLRHRDTSVDRILDQLASNSGNENAETAESSCLSASDEAKKMTRRARATFLHGSVLLFLIGIHQRRINWNL